jgi:iron complex outermembrane recepter protein
LRGNFTLKHFLTEGYFSSTVETTFAQQKVSEFETPSNDYTLLHLSLGGKVQLAKMKFDFSLNANNVLNRTYIAHLSRLKSSGIPNIGRNIVLGLTFVI